MTLDLGQLSAQLWKMNQRSKKLEMKIPISISLKILTYKKETVKGASQA